MIYVFISQNIRLPNSTQFPIFKLIKHMKYTYSSKIIHTSSNSSLQLSFTTFWKNIFFHWSFIVPFYAKTIGESTAFLLTAGDEHDYEKFYKIPLKSYWAGRLTTKKLWRNNYKTLFKSTGAIYQRVKNLPYLLCYRHVKCSPPPHPPL